MKESVPKLHIEPKEAKKETINPATERALERREKQFDWGLQLILKACEDPENLDLVTEAAKTKTAFGKAAKEAIRFSRGNKEDVVAEYFIKVKENIETEQNKKNTKSKANDLFLKQLKGRVAKYLEDQAWTNVDNIKDIIESFKLYEANKAGTMLNARLRVEFDDLYKKARRLIKKDRNDEAHQLLLEAKKIAEFSDFQSDKAKKIKQDIDTLL